jgi:hypothetical protein
MRTALLVLVLAALCLSTANAASTLKYAYSYSDDDNTPPTSYATEPELLAAYLPMWDLGILETGWTIQVTINQPNVASSTLLFDTVAAGLTLYVLDNTDPADIKYSPAVESDGTTAFAFTAPATGKTSFSGTYTVYMPSAASGTSAKFQLGFIGQSGTAGTLNTEKISYLNIQVDYFNGTGFSAGSTTNPVQTLLKVTETGRNDVVKFIYVAPSSPAFQFALYPFSVDTPGSATAVQGDFEAKLYSITLAGTDTSLTANDWVLADVSTVKYTDEANTATNAPFAADSTVEQWKMVDDGGSDFELKGKVAHWEFYLDPGFYLIEHYYTGADAGLTTLKPWFTFQTDSYACPYNPDFGDYYANFQGCTVSFATEGLPCASFDQVNKICTLCIEGYTLVNGTCWANTTCPDRKYFKFGQCLDVSPTCGDFDKFTGACLNCSDPANYENINGSCTRRSVTCAPNQYQTNYTCFNASTTCATFDPNSGKCLSCISKLYQLNTDGTCTKRVLECAEGQYSVEVGEELFCVNVPQECLNFNTTTYRCLACIQGYYNDGGFCKKIVCPEGQVPSKYGIFCVSVSSLCATYDSLTGGCLSCKQNNHAVRDGKCVQISSPLAGCKEREAFGYGPCVGAEIDCHTFNLQTGNCDQCKEGFYLNYAGLCQRNVPCGANQYSVNGECLGFPDNCLSVDSLGLCTSCVSADYRLQQGQCVFFKRCSGQQYLNAGGQCADVNAACATWNPSNGQCITCKVAGTTPVTGVCCPLGQIFSGNSCVDANQLQQTFATATGPSCLLRHPSINICLRCSPNFDIDYTIPFGCRRRNN